MSYTLFISDIHLEPDTPETTKAFESVFKGPALTADAVYILGDLFNTWIGDDDLTPYNRHIIDVIHNFTTNTKIPTYFIRGNRDLLVKKRFFEMTGMMCLDELTLIDLYGTKTLLLHGDILCVQDAKYLKFRQHSYNPIHQFIYLNLPLKLRRSLINFFRKKSNKHAQSKTYAHISDACPQEVTRIMQQYNVTQMIHGHTHKPKIHDNGRIVLGAWHDSNSILYVHDTGEIDLTSQHFPARVSSNDS